MKIRCHLLLLGLSIAISEALCDDTDGTIVLIMKERRSMKSAGCANVKPVTLVPTRQP